ncbi:MAG: Dabb family protein [Nitrososphaerota archaeon]|nr:Dabb family protein [Nitrososphaerota archaeon]
MTKQDKQKAADEIRALQGQIPGLLETSYNANISPRSQGFTHGGVMKFRDQAALEAYFSGKPVRAGSFDVPLSVYELSVVPGEGFEVAEKGGVFVALPRERDRKLVAEGLVRDLARRLQALRKEKGFVPTAMLGSASVAGLEAEDVEFVEPLKDELAYLVRVKRVSLSTEKAGKGWSEAELDGKPVYLRVG